FVAQLLDSFFEIRVNLIQLVVLHEELGGKLDQFLIAASNLLSLSTRAFTSCQSYRRVPWGCHIYSLTVSGATVARGNPSRSPVKRANGLSKVRLYSARCFPHVDGLRKHRSPPAHMWKTSGHGFTQETKLCTAETLPLVPR